MPKRKNVPGICWAIDSVPFCPQPTSTHRPSRCCLFLRIPRLALYRLLKPASLVLSPHRCANIAEHVLQLDFGLMTGRNRPIAVFADKRNRTHLRSQSAGKRQPLRADSRLAKTEKEGPLPLLAPLHFLFLTKYSKRNHQKNAL
ncbi:hypothetical protein D3C87_1651040 [compost metagenome]